MPNSLTYETLYTERLEKQQEIRRLEELIRQSEQEIKVLSTRLTELDALAYRLASAQR